MLGDPVGEPLGEGHVIERRGELTGVAFDLDELVDVARVVDAANAQQAHVVGRELRVLQPCSPEEVAAADAEGADVCRRLGGGALDLEGELGRGALVGVEDEDPRMAEWKLHCGVALTRVGVEGARSDGGAARAGDLGGAVGGVGVEDVDVVGPCDGVEAAGQVLLLVEREDEDGDVGRGVGFTG